MSVEIVVSDVRRVTADPMRNGQWALQIDTIDGTFAVAMTKAQAKAMARSFDAPEGMSAETFKAISDGLNEWVPK